MSSSWGARFPPGNKRTTGHKTEKQTNKQTNKTGLEARHERGEWGHIRGGLAGKQQPLYCGKWETTEDAELSWVIKVFLEEDRKPQLGSQEVWGLIACHQLALWASVCPTEGGELAHVLPSMTSNSEGLWCWATDPLQGSSVWLQKHLLSTYMSGIGARRRMQHLTPHLGRGPVVNDPIAPITRTANSYKAFITC